MGSILSETVSFSWTNEKYILISTTCNKKFEKNVQIFFIRHDEFGDKPETENKFSKMQGSFVKTKLNLTTVP